jgi:1-acyl-sn-glycerol-3-phosphate acyltransferase
MFPEGTRTRDGNLRPFREGAFTLALHTQTPILPIIINGTFDAIPKKRFVMTHRQDIVVRILDPIPPGDFGTTDVKELKEKIRDLMLENYTLLRSEMEKK